MALSSNVERVTVKKAWRRPAVRTTAVSVPMMNLLGCTPPQTDCPLDNGCFNVTCDECVAGCP